MRMTSTVPATSCHFCDLPVGAAPLRDGGHAFCCFGCREVYRRFGHAVLPDDAGNNVRATMAEPEGHEAFLRIDGMHCASCELLIEKIARQVNGIVAATCSYATSTAKITYDPEQIDESELPDILSRAGYRARLSRDSAPEYDERLPLLRLMVAESLAVTVMMLYLAFYYPTHLGLVDVADLEPVHWLAFEAVPAALLVLTTVLVFYVAAPIFRGAWVGLRTGLLNMDDLLAIAILAAYGYSIGQLAVGSLEFYFDVVAAIIAVVTLGRYLEQQAKVRATTELSHIMATWTPTARVRRGDEFCTLTLPELQPEDRVVIRTGETIPIDGKIIEGQVAVDESLLTGEPFPVNRGPGEHVIGGTSIVEGELEIAVGYPVESQLDNLARALWNAQSVRAGARGMADRVAHFFVPVVLILALVVTGLMFREGASLGTALLAGMATLIVSCPCTFGLAIPLTSAAGVSTALHNGIIITSADIFEKPARADTIVIDKTGTLSTGDMAVGEVLGPPQVREYAAAVERLSPHPIAKAITALGSHHTAANIENHPGKGAIATVDGHRTAVGSRSLFASLGWDIPAPLLAEAAVAAPDEGTVSYVGWDGYAQGAIVTHDQLRPGWEKVIDQLKQQGRVVLLTGAEHPGDCQNRMDEVFAGIPPQAKAAVIRQLRTEGSVFMIGDGSNDAPALAAADLGLAFGAPTALAADAADAIIPGDHLEGVFTALGLIHTVRRRIRQNLGWALLYNATAIPLAVSGLLNPLFAALAMSASSLLVVWNSSRSLHRAKPAPNHGGKHSAVTAT